ncbi:hypothetical protein DFQ27_007183, partial [Actinomortierella ambigua]
MSSLNNSNKASLGHDALPPPVDFSEASPSLGLQFRGLARKTLSYHRHQIKINIGCLVIWPFFIVTLVYLLSLLRPSFPKEPDTDSRLCVNEADPFYGVLHNMEAPTFSPFGSTSLKFVNGAVVAPWFPQDLGETLPDPLPCVRWFGDHIPVKHPYENASFPFQPEPHTFYTPPPAGTWYKAEEVLEKYPRTDNSFDSTDMDGYPRRREPRAFEQYNSIQQNVFIYYPDNLQSVIGQFPNVTPSFSTPSEGIWPPTDPSIVYKAPNNTASSLLGNIPVRYTNMGESYLGFLWSMDGERYETSKFIRVPDVASMNAALLKMIAIASNGSIYNEDALKDFGGGWPFGGMIIDSVDMDQMRLKMTMHMTMTKSKFPKEVFPEPPAGLRQLITMSQMTSSLMKHKFGSNFTITQGIRIMPFVWSPKSLYNASLNDMPYFIPPFALVFLLPMFVWMLVQEKEDRHCMMMAMNGLRKPVYYAAHYIEFMCLQLVMSLFFGFATAAYKMELTGRTSPGFLAITFVIWAHTQITLSFVLASFFSRAQKASLMVYFFVAVSCVIAMAPTTVFRSGIPTVWSIHPIFALFRVLQVANQRATMINGLYPVMVSDIRPGTTVFTNLMILLAQSVIFMILTG